MHKKIKKFTVLEPIEITYSNGIVQNEPNAGWQSKSLNRGKLKIDKPRGYQGPSIPTDVDWYENDYQNPGYLEEEQNTKGSR